MSTETKVRKDTAIKQLANALIAIQGHCIGIAVIEGKKGMIVEYDYENNYMQVITPLPLGGMANEHMSADSKHIDSFGLFPDMTLTEMLDNPTGYLQWCKDYNIVK